MRCIAVDWSGAQDPARQRAAMWLAEAEGGKLLRLEKDRTRDQIAALLMRIIQEHGDMAIGLDFAFSYPEWYLRERGLINAGDLWQLAAKEGDTWLGGKAWPFWGRPGPYQKRPPDLGGNRQFRQTELALKGRGFHPKSVFQVYGAGAVGTGTVRGLPILADLQDAGAAIWPFDASKLPMVIEIYPRVLIGHIVTNNSGARAEYLDLRFPSIDRELRQAMVVSADAFDAGVSALVMAGHTNSLSNLSQATDPTKQLEGEIWRPEKCPPP